MIRGLVLIAVGGAALSAVCISASGATGSLHWHVPGIDWNISVDHKNDTRPPLKVEDSTKTATRTLDWDGGDKLGFDVPASITYTQGPTTKITVTGPSALLDHLTLDDDTISLDRSFENLDRADALTISITAPDLHEFELNSAQKLDIRNLDTDELNITVQGTALVTAAGRAKSAEIQLNGVGNADLTNLTLTDAHIEINGVGHAKAGPTGDANIEINGAGAVTLTKHPAHLDQEINGPGKVDEPGENGQSL